MQKPLLVLALNSGFMSVAAENVILVSIDGLRWQDVFNGAQLDIIENKEAVARPQQVKKDFWHKNLQQRREKLMPFFGIL